MNRFNSIVLSVIVLLSCSKDSFSPTLEDVAGTYALTALRATSPTDTTDFLADGSTIDILLAGGGTVTGTLHIVGGAENGGDLDADMTGTWALSGTTVTFDQAADTFVRDVDFTATRDGRLVVTWVDQGTSIHVELTRQ